MKLKYYTSELGVYITGRVIPSYRTTEVFRLNGVTPQSTFASDWFYVPVESIESIEEFKSGTNKLVGFKLIDSKLVSARIKDYLTVEEVQFNPDPDPDDEDDEDDEDEWENEEFTAIKSLYSRVNERGPDEWIAKEFELEYLGHLDIGSPDSITDMTLTIAKRNYSSNDPTEVKLSSIARFSDLDKMIVPGCAMHVRPCSITSRQTYDIIRSYVKDNYNPKCCEITSDYDFCFTVKRKIAIKPYERKREIKKKTGRSYARPKFVATNITYNSVEVFEMTTKDKPYNNYTPVDGFKGESIADLAENVKLYLEELIAYINHPSAECEHCKGTGIVDAEITFGMNDRSMGTVV